MKSFDVIPHQQNVTLNNSVLVAFSHRIIFIRVELIVIIETTFFHIQKNLITKYSSE